MESTITPKAYNHYLSVNENEKSLEFTIRGLVKEVHNIPDVSNDMIQNIKKYFYENANTKEEILDFAKEKVAIYEILSGAIEDKAILPCELMYKAIFKDYTRKKFEEKYCNKVIVIDNLQVIRSDHTPIPTEIVNQFMGKYKVCFISKFPIKNVENKKINIFTDGCNIEKDYHIAVGSEIKNI